MNVFEAVKENVTVRQAAQYYGIRVNKNGMAVCPFHDDKNPSMKVDKRFHCFGCQSDGDVIDFAAKLHGLPVKEAAEKLAADFGIAYDARGKAPPVKISVRKRLSEAQKQKQDEQHCFRVLSDYYHLLRLWEKEYSPQPGDAILHPLFVEAQQKKTDTEYLLDILLHGTKEERKALTAGHGKEVAELERRISGFGRNFRQCRNRGERCMPARTGTDDR